MMDCSQYRRSMLTDPRDASQLLAAHRESCPECTQFTERLLRFETRLDRALRVAAPAGNADRVVPLRPRGLSRALSRRVLDRRGWLAIAASVLVAVILAGGLWLAVPGPSLAADVVTHMAGEPDAWRQTDLPVPESDLSGALRDSHLRLNPSAGVVSYARSCSFRGRSVPHLVVQTAAGPVTVMVLVHEPVKNEVQFAEKGYRGVIVPVPGHGSLAVLTRGGTSDPKSSEEIARRVLDAIVWTS
jgi:hypothetical protein